MTDRSPAPGSASEPLRPPRTSARTARSASPPTPVPAIGCVTASRRGPRRPAPQSRADPATLRRASPAARPARCSLASPAGDPLPGSGETRAGAPPRMEPGWRRALFLGANLRCAPAGTEVFLHPRLSDCGRAGLALKRSSPCPHRPAPTSLYRLRYSFPRLTARPARPGTAFAGAGGRKVGGDLLVGLRPSSGCRADGRIPQRRTAAPRLLYAPDVGAENGESRWSELVHGHRAR